MFTLILRGYGIKKPKAFIGGSNMSTEKSLNELRAEIDGIDDSIHDLIIRRTKVVNKVRKVKRGERVKIRPEREAEILYRLIRQHKGDFPKREMCRMWREMIVATLSMEGPFSMAICASEASNGLWDLARDQYGSYTPMLECSGERQVIDVVARQDATVGVLPLPRQGNPDPWWRYLINGGQDAPPDAPKVIARLPFAGTGNSRSGCAQALVICPVIHRPTKDIPDHSYFAIEAQEELPPDFLGAALSKDGATLFSSISWRDANSSGPWFYLVETGEFTTGLRPTAPMTRVTGLGGYALPLSEEELDTGGEAP